MVHSDCCDQNSWVDFARRVTCLNALMLSSFEAVWIVCRDHGLRAHSVLSSGGIFAVAMCDGGRRTTALSFLLAPPPRMRHNNVHARVVLDKRVSFYMYCERVPSVSTKDTCNNRVTG